MRPGRRSPAILCGFLLGLGLLLPAPAPAGAAQAADSPEDARIRESVERIFSAPEYRRFGRAQEEAGEPGWLQRFLDWLMNRNRDQRRREVGSAFSLTLGSIVQILLYALVGVAAVLVAVLIIKAILDRAAGAGKTGAPGAEGGAIIDPDVPPGELPWEEYLREARALAERGEHRPAVRLLLLAAMSWIERHGLIRHRRGLTNRDYLRAVWRREPCRESMAAIIDIFDRIYFGRRPATAESFERCVERFQGGFLSDEKSGPVAV